MLARLMPTVDPGRYSRRLSDMVGSAFDQACEEGDLITASDLLAILELVLLKTPPRDEQRDDVLSLLYECQARLFNLKYERNGIVALQLSNGSGEA